MSENAIQESLYGETDTPELDASPAVDRIMDSVSVGLGVMPHWIEKTGPNTPSSGASILIYVTFPLPCNRLTQCALYNLGIMGLSYYDEMVANAIITLMTREISVFLAPPVV